ncbi:MAG TPA: hypothetical protein PKO36_05160 [Candidatus Hydrogenedentes bacterium]|nr:hypothetical protein [Candidatus Hydrogenedentota bacterium]HOV75251.1 hypothetical protein [Candidatus Hydrogenedentota bacterium]
MKKRFLVIVAVAVIAASPVQAGTTDVPRILVAGDSWGAFMQLLRSLDSALPDFGWTGIGQRGHNTTSVGARAFSSEDPDPRWLARIQQELADYPTIDIVHLSLGGNDIVFDSFWYPGMSEQAIQARIDGIVGKIAEIVDGILAIRPNVRVALCGYDFGNHPIPGMSISQMNAIWVRFEQARKEMALAKSPRVFYVHNLGLMQYHYGIPLANPPIAPGQVPYPGGFAENYVPMPGGDPNYNGPLESLMDDDMHLTLEGYDYIAHRCFSEIYNTWLSWPVVYEILPEAQTAKSPLQTFRVTFSKPVSGVDETDFAVSGVAGATVANVIGNGAQYTVAVNLNGGAGTVQLAVADDDTIVDDQARPLGGNGANNGNFAHNGPLQFADPELAGPADFDGAMWSLSRAFTVVSWMLGGQQFDPDHCDANGGSIAVNPPSIIGNNMLDSAELALVYECLRDNTIDLSGTGGIAHWQVVHAYAHNHTQILADLGGPDGRVLRSVPGMDIMMAGFMTLGDSGSTLIPVLLITAVSAFIQFPGVSTPDILNYERSLAQYLGPGGDADGDGFTNRQEYEQFFTSGGREAYVRAALNPFITPPSCANTQGGTFDEGQAFCLGVPGQFDIAGGFQWFHNGEPIADNGRITGSRTRDLHIHALKASDAGEYECVYDNESKRFGPVLLGVTSHTPVAGMGGLCVLAAALIAGAMAGQRERR